MKKAFLTIEAIVLLAPITIALGYTTFLTLFIGIPASVTQQFGSGNSYDLFLPVSAIGNISGVYAIVVLWLLVIKTIQKKVYRLSKHFYIALGAGIFASASLVFIFGIHGFIYGVLPVAIAAAHFLYLQKGIKSYA